jgi:hypothetical protein
MAFELQDTYFRRFFVPIVISILVLCGVIVVVAVPLSTPLNWATSKTVLDGNGMKGGFLKFLRR